jgi:TatD DNase family protein
MIDTHAHIYLKDFKEDIDQIFKNALEAGITDICMPAIDVYSIDQMDKLNPPEGLSLHPMFGVHPSEMKGGRCNLEATLLAGCSRKDVVAVGETGLDYYWTTDYIAPQKQSLRLHCKVAKTLQKPIVLHNRDSTDDLLDIIEEEQNGALRGVWHCFTGTVEEGKRALDLGLHLGIGGITTFKNAGVDKAVKELPLDKMMLETDAPFLAPEPNRGKRNEPAYTKFVAEKLADLFETSVEEIDRITTATARGLFGI